MNAILAGIIFAVVLSAGILVLLEIGRRVGLRRIAEEGETASKGLSAIEGAIFGLLGLILAFLFSGALTRFDAARHLVVEEANDIGTAWLRISLLPADAQPSIRELFRRYLDSRIEIYRRVPNIADMEAVRAGRIDKFAKRDMGPRCLILTRSWNGLHAVVASARAQRNVRNRHDANRGH